jgi:peptidyl-prolyl cis-trans isomerase SurA
MFRWFVVSILCVPPCAFAADVRVVEEIAAKEKILERTLREEQHLTGPALAVAVREQEKDILANQISQRLLVQRAKDMQMNVDTDVNKELIQMQVDAKIQDTEKFHEFVHQQTGMAFEDYKQQMIDVLLTRRVISAEVGSKVNIPEADLRKYYDEHKSEFIRKAEVYLSQILISTEGKSPEQIANAEKTAKDLVARAKKGEKFSELAAANSDDPATAHDGGELPPYQPDQLREDLRAIVAKTAKGQVTDPPIRTQQGFLILKVNERFEEGLAPFDEVSDRIHEYLAQPLQQPKIQEFLNKLRQEAYLEIKDGYIDTQAAPGKDTRWHEVAPIKAQTVTKEEVLATRKRKKFLGIFPHGKVPAKPVDTQSLGEPKDTSQTTPPAPDKTTPDQPAPIDPNAPPPPIKK